MDGSKIVFVWMPSEAPSISGRAPDGLYVMNADGSGKRLVLHGDRFQRPKFSPSGDWITFSNGTIWKVSIEGDSVVKVYDGGLSRDPVWSPDGKSIALGSTEGSPVANGYYLRIADAGGTGNHLALFADNPLLCNSTVWQINSQSIMFLEPLEHCILRFNPGSSELDTVLSNIYMRGFDAAGDDSLIVYEHDNYIWAHRIDEMHSERIWPFCGMDVSISFDGERVLFISAGAETQYAVIWVSSIDGTLATQLTSITDSLGT